LSGDDCVQCHRYHFGRPKVSSLKTQLNRQQQQ
jgi:predicted CXXCH cytochrome family protein